MLACGIILAVVAETEFTMLLASCGIVFGAVALLLAKVDVTT